MRIVGHDPNLGHLISHRAHRVRREKSKKICVLCVLSERKGKHSIISNRPRDKREIE